MRAIITALLRVLPCTVYLTPVGPSVHGLQIESYYYIIFAWSNTIAQHYIALV